MPLTLKTINEGLAKLGYKARLARGTGYCYFFGGEAADWLDNTVRVSALSNLTLEDWIGNFERLRKLNERIMKGKPKLKK